LPAPDELAPVVSLDARVLEPNAARLQMIQDDRGEELRVGERALLREADVMPARGDLAGRVLVARQAERLRLRPQFGDVTQVLRIDGGLLEEPPRLLHLSQALLGLVLPALASRQPLVSPDAADGLLRERKPEVAFHPPGAPRRQPPLERDGTAALALRYALSWVKRRAAPVFQPLKRAGLPPPQPFTD